MSNQTLEALLRYHRSDWWHGPARPRPLVPADHAYIEIHHTAVRGHYLRLPTDVLNQIELDHRNRGWNGIFYGVFIATDGTIWEARGVGWRSIGAHPARYLDGTPVDRDALTVLLPGDYRFDQITPAQVAAIERLRAACPDQRVRWHGMRLPFTECPGTNAIATLEGLNTHPPDTTDPAEPEDDMRQLVRDPNGGVYLYNGETLRAANDGIYREILKLTGAQTPTAEQAAEWGGVAGEWFQWDWAGIEAVPPAVAVDVAALAAALAAVLPAEIDVDVDQIAAAVADELVGRLAS